jgi:hypothetical protein
LLTYSFGVIKWSKTNLQNINIQTRVLFTKFCKHHPKSAIERFNLPRENGGRGFSNLEILQHNQIASLKNYFLNRARDNTFFNALVSADKGYTPLNLSDNIISDIVGPNIPDTIANIKQKSLHGRYFKELEQPEINIQASHAWLKKSNIHPETEGFIFAIQDIIKKHICGLDSIIDKCRICGTEGETIEHIISSCTVLAQSEYKKRHDIFAKIIHMNLAVKFNLLKDTQPHYIYKPESCLENDNYKLYFDRTVLTDIHIQHNRPDIIILNKQQKQAYLLDMYSEFFLRLAIGFYMLIFQPPVNFCSDENIQTIFGIKLEDVLNYRIHYNSISQTVEKVVKKIFSGRRNNSTSSGRQSSAIVGSTST